MYKPEIVEIFTSLIQVLENLGYISGNVRVSQNVSCISERFVHMEQTSRGQPPLPPESVARGTRLPSAVFKGGLQRALFKL